MGAIGREVAEGVAGGQMSPAGIENALMTLFFKVYFYIEFFDTIRDTII